jgi:peptide/nickel transport system substrate-binding protein
MAEDGTSFTFKVRDGVYFTNGQQCTADDVIFTFEQIRDDTEHYPDSVAKNWRNYLDELEKIDEMTVKMNFTQAFPEFWKLAASPDIQVIPANAYEDKTWEEFWEAPIGTGAYQVVNFDSANSNLSLTIRTDEHGYWGYDYAGTYTNVKNINIMYSPESTTRLASLRSGEVQLIDTIPTSEKDNLDSEGFTTTMTTPGNVVFLEFACAEDDAFGDAKLREALSLCIDRDLIVEMLLDGYAYPAKYLCLESDLGYQSEADGNYYQYDVERAKELVAESSYNGEPLDFIYTASTVNIGGELCQAIQSMANDVGINLQIRMLETAVYDDARSNHDYDLSLACIANSGNMWYKQAHDVTGDDRFNSGCTNQELLALGQALGQTADQTEMDSILKQMYNIQMTTFEPYINIYFPTVLFAQQSNVTNIQWHNYLIPDLSAVVIN